MPAATGHQSNRPTTKRIISSHVTAYCHCSRTWWSWVQHNDAAITTLTPPLTEASWNKWFPSFSVGWPPFPRHISLFLSETWWVMISVYHSIAFWRVFLWFSLIKLDFLCPQQLLHRPHCSGIVRSLPLLRTSTNPTSETSYKFGRFTHKLLGSPLFNSTIN